MRFLHLEEWSKRRGLALRAFLGGESVKSDQPKCQQCVPTGKIKDRNDRVNRRQRNRR